MPTPGAAHQPLLDVELSLGSTTGSGLHGEPVLHHDRGAQRVVAGLRDTEYDAANFLQGIAGTLELFHRSALVAPGTGPGGHRAPGGGLPTHRPSRLQAPDRRTGIGRHRHAHGVRSRPSALRTRSRPRRDRGDHRVAEREGACLLLAPITMSASPTTTASAKSRSTNTTATAWSLANNASASTPAR